MSSQLPIQFPTRKSSRKTVRKLFGDVSETKKTIRQSSRLKNSKNNDTPTKRIPFSPIKPDSPNIVLSPTPVELIKSTHSSPIRKLNFSESTNETKKTLSPVKNLRSPLKRLKTPSKIISSSSPMKLISSSSPMKLISSSSPRKTNSTPIKNCQQSNNTIIYIPSSPRKPARDYGVCYQRAKQCLHTAQPERGMVGRTNEKIELTEFLDSHLLKKKPGCLYISGPPGTGKSALLMQTITDYSDFHVISANCMTLHRAEHIYNKLLKDLMASQSDNDYSELSTRQAMIQLQKYVTSKGKMILMVLDEIDQLDTKTQEVLYTIFEWPSLNKSRLVLIGIANSLDLTDRVLPRLQARTQCLPKLLQFAPYTKDQLVNIITDRLVDASVEGECVMEKASIQFAARKVAALAGDVRKALDICRAAVELVQTSSRRNKTIVPPSVVPSSPHKPFCLQQKRIGLVDIMKVINRSTQNAIVAPNRDSCTFPLQQKLILCTLALILRSHVSGKRQQVLLGNFHDSYCKVARKRKVNAVDQSEFIALLDLIEARAIIICKKNKVIRSSRIILNLNEKDLQFALNDNTLMSSIMAEGIVKK